ncbi:MAG: YigZ family protein [Lachnospiraceae bacterium]
MQSYKILLQGGSGEIEEKKSRFIANLRPVESEEEATAFIEEMKKKYWDARHNCSAFVIGKNNEIMRSSDDGEPSGTAGRPMLEILTKDELHNVVVVVTRYFGGTLLGTGGLIRAYSESVKAGLANCKIGRLTNGRELVAVFPYTEVGRIQNYLISRGWKEKNADYTDVVSMTLEIPEDDLEQVKIDFIELTCGKVEMLEGKTCNIITTVPL